MYDFCMGDKIFKLVGYVDNIRVIFIDDFGDMIFSVSGDKIVKMWSVKGGCCMYIFIMYDDSVWFFFFEDLRFGIFYSSDRFGMVVKIDVCGNFDYIDDGFSFVICCENFGVSKVVVVGGYIWIVINKFLINRWEDVDMSIDV